LGGSLPLRVIAFSRENLSSNFKNVAFSVTEFRCRCNAEAARVNLIARFQGCVS
jgi:hypothetical protein